MMFLASFEIAQMKPVTMKKRPASCSKLPRLKQQLPRPLGPCGLDMTLLEVRDRPRWLDRHSRVSSSGGRGWFAGRSSVRRLDTCTASPCCECCVRGVGGLTRWRRTSRRSCTCMVARRCASQEFRSNIIESSKNINHFRFNGFHEAVPLERAVDEGPTVTRALGLRIDPKNNYLDRAVLRLNRESE